MLWKQVRNLRKTHLDRPENVKTLWIVCDRLLGEVPVYAVPGPLTTHFFQDARGRCDVYMRDTYVCMRISWL